MTKRACVPAMIVVVIAGSLCGCANARFYRGADLALASNAVVIHGVPTVAQTNQYSCGRACLASVALYYDVPFPAVENATLSGTGREEALSAGELVELAESLGLVGFGYEGSFDDLMGNLEKKRPILALLDSPPRAANYPAVEWIGETSSRIAARPHWVVVLGLSNKEVIIYDPAKGVLAMSRENFDEQWQKQSRVAVLVGQKS